MGTATGVVYAADSARPGDVLYPIDRGVEEVQLRFTSSPDRRIILLIALANERILETQQLAEIHGVDVMSIALDDYGTTILEISQIVDEEPERDELLVTQIDDELALQEERLQTIRGKVPEQAYPGLDRAIEAIHTGQNIIHPGNSSENPVSPAATPGPPQSFPKPGSSDKNPGRPPDHVPGPPIDLPTPPVNPGGDP
jgi:hypothetical protein